MINNEPEYSETMSQAVHWREPFSAYEFSAHSSQDDAPSPLNVPAGHLEHSDV